MRSAASSPPARSTSLLRSCSSASGATRSTCSRTHRSATRRSISASARAWSRPRAPRSARRSRRRCARRQYGPCGRARGPRVATLNGMRPDRDAILVALERVIDPELKRPVTDLEMVRDVVVSKDGAVAVTIALTVAGCPLRSSFQDQVAHHVGAVPGVTDVTLHFDVMSPEEKATLATRLRGGRPPKEIRLDPSTRVVAVTSGKGGVGKSTLSANLAAALAERG